jgi:hypothetical protein
VYANAF